MESNLAGVKIYWENFKFKMYHFFVCRYDELESWKLIGEGHFGQVYRAYWRGGVIAVKKSKKLGIIL